jgi:hypothetical protein
LVAAVVARTFVVLSQFLNRKLHDPKLLVVQFHTVIQRDPIGFPPMVFTLVVRSKVQVPD